MCLLSLSLGRLVSTDLTMTLYGVHSRVEVARTGKRQTANEYGYGYRVAGADLRTDYLPTSVPT